MVQDKVYELLMSYSLYMIRCDIKLLYMRRCNINLYT